MTSYRLRPSDTEALLKTIRTQLVEHLHSLDEVGAAVSEVIARQSHEDLLQAADFSAKLLIETESFEKIQEELREASTQVTSLLELISGIRDLLHPYTPEGLNNETR